MVPGMGHCDGGPGPNTWDRLAPLVDWVENGKAPDFLVATHSGPRGTRRQGNRRAVDNERKICPLPAAGRLYRPCRRGEQPGQLGPRQFCLPLEPFSILCSTQCPASAGLHDGPPEGGHYVLR